MKVVRINAVWCSGCLVMKKVWRDIEKEIKNIEFIDYDYDMDEEEVKKYNIGDIVPVNIFYVGDKEVSRLIGEKSKNEVLEEVKKVLNYEV